MPDTYVNRFACAVASAPGAAGSIVLGAASTGYRTLGAAQNGQSFTVTLTDGAAWEVRTGCVYTHSTTTLTRGTLEESSTGSAITLGAATIVTGTLSAGTLASVSGAGFVSSTSYASAAALETAFPAASNPGALGFVTSLGVYVSSGATWVRASSLARVGQVRAQITNGALVAQSLSASTNVKLTTALNTVVANPASEWDNTTKRFTPVRPGVYLFRLAAQTGATSSSIVLHLYQNGIETYLGQASQTATFPLCSTVVPAYANGSTDYFESYIFSTNATAIHNGAGAATFTSFQAVYLGEGA